MNVTDIVSIATYVTVTIDSDVTVIARDSELMGYRVASTPKTVPHLVEPARLAEIAVLNSEA